MHLNLKKIKFYKRKLFTHRILYVQRLTLNQKSETPRSRTLKLISIYTTVSPEHTIGQQRQH